MVPVYAVLLFGGEWRLWRVGVCGCDWLTEPVGSSCTTNSGGSKMHRNGWGGSRVEVVETSKVFVWESSMIPVYAVLLLGGE